MSAERSVLIRGAGVVGLCCAVTLAEAGSTVTVVEAGRSIEVGASWRAGGMLAPWCEAETAPFPLADMGPFSLDWWRRHFAETVFNGTLVLASIRDQRELDRFARRTTHHRSLDGDAIAIEEPDLAGRFARGLFFSMEGHLDPRRALAALLTRAAELGVAIRFSEAELPDASFDSVVDARGLGGRDSLDDLRGVRGEMLLVRCPDLRLNRPIRLLHPRYPIYVVPRAEHVFMIGATMIETDDDGGIRLRSAMDLMNAAYTLHPALADAELLEAAAGRRPSFPDNVPRIRRDGKTIFANGMYRHGFLMGPVLAKEVQDLLAGS